MVLIRPTICWFCLILLYIVFILFGDVRSLKICTKNCTMIYDWCVVCICRRYVQRYGEVSMFFSRRCGASTLDGRWMGTCPMDLRLRLRSLCRCFREWDLSPSRDAGHSDCSCRWDIWWDVVSKFTTLPGALFWWLSILIKVDTRVFHCSARCFWMPSCLVLRQTGKDIEDAE